MKNIFTLIAVCAMASGLQAQNNLNLENWQSITGTESPTDWVTYNSFKDFSLTDSASVKKAKPAYSGQFAAKIRPVLIDFGFQYWLPGTMYQMYASSARPKSFRFAYKYASTVSGDPALAAVYFYKGGTADTNNIVGQAIVWLNPSSSYTYVNKEITWNNANTPDTGYISFNTGPMDTASLLTIDDVSLSSFSAGTTEMANSPLSVFVRQDQNLQVQGMESWMERLNLFDGMGRLVRSYPLQHAALLSTKGLNAGVYFVEVSGRDSRVTGKIVL